MIRLPCAGILLLVYGAPLFFPPASSAAAVGGEAGFLARLFPDVPSWWVAGRLVALAAAALLLSGTPALLVSPAPDDAPAQSNRMGARALGALALGVAVLHALSAPWARHLGPAGQTGYLALAFVPAFVLALPRSWRRSWRSIEWKDAVPALVVTLVWVAGRLVTDLGSPRVADMVDAWRGFVAIALASAHRTNLFSDLLDPELPGLGSALLFFHGVPLLQADVVSLGMPTLQLFQIAWVAIAGLGIGVLARMVVGPGAAVIAVTVFLFAPYTRFVTIFPGPFLAGPLYAAALALCALAASRRHSNAALAALGPLGGLAVTFPGVVPVAGLFAVTTAWSLRAEWRRVWLGAAAGFASLVAVVLPAVPNVLTPGRMAQHFQAHGTAVLLEPALLGQLPVGTFEVARASMVRRPFDIVAAALLEPFANPRTAIRLWGDAIFDPAGAALLAIGLVVCVRSARRSVAARWLLLFFAAALCPAFVSPVDRVDIVHAVALPVPAALLAAAGFATLQGSLAARLRRAATLLTVVVIGLGGSILFDVVNPRILPASAPGIMFRVLAPEAAPRVVVLDYPRDHGIDVRWLFTGPMTAYAGPRPVGFLPYAGGALPDAGLTAEGKDLLFWSPGLEQDAAVTAAICAQWPDATLYEIWDLAHRSRVQAARVGGAAWEPDAPATRWRRRTCGPPLAMPTRPAGCRARA